MTKVASPIAALGANPDSEDLAIGDLARQNQALRAELDEVQPVISAACLAATAFRLRDQDALVSALRLLTRAMLAFEERRAAA